MCSIYAINVWHKGRENSQTSSDKTSHKAGYIYSCQREEMIDFFDVHICAVFCFPLQISGKFPSRSQYWTLTSIIEQEVCLVAWCNACFTVSLEIQFLFDFLMCGIRDLQRSWVDKRPSGSPCGQLPNFFRPLRNLVKEQQACLLYGYVYGLPFIPASLSGSISRDRLDTFCNLNLTHCITVLIRRILLTLI